MSPSSDDASLGGTHCVRDAAAVCRSVKLVYSTLEVYTPYMSANECTCVWSVWFGCGVDVASWVTRMFTLPESAAGACKTLRRSCSGAPPMGHVPAVHMGSFEIPNADDSRRAAANSMNRSMIRVRDILLLPAC
eukprot:2687398-Rhodomonas_salina.1